MYMQLECRLYIGVQFIHKIYKEYILVAERIKQVKRVSYIHLLPVCRLNAVV